MVNGVTGGAGAAQTWRHAGGSGGDVAPHWDPSPVGHGTASELWQGTSRANSGVSREQRAGGGCSAGAGGPCRPPPCSSCPWQAAPWDSCVTLSPLSLACPDLGVTSSTMGRCQSDPPFCSQTAASSLLCIQGHPRMALAARAEEENSPEQTEEHGCFPACKVSVSPGWGGLDRETPQAQQGAGSQPEPAGALEERESISPCCSQPAKEQRAKSHKQQQHISLLPNTCPAPMNRRFGQHLWDNSSAQKRAEVFSPEGNLDLGTNRCVFWS